VLADLGTWMGYAGQWEQGKEWVARSMLLNPKHQSWLHQVWHLDHYLKGEILEFDKVLAGHLRENGERIIGIRIIGVNIDSTG